MRFWLLGTAALLTACPQEKPEVPQAPPPAAEAPVTAPTSQAATATASVAVEPAPEWNPKTTPGAICRWQLTETYGEQLGADASAGYQLTADIRGRATSPTHWELVVERVQTRGKRGDYKANLDSNEPGIMRRISGGADTTVMFDMVTWFALIGQPITFTVSTQGRVVRVDGGKAVRERLHSWFPPAPRKLARSKDLANMALSDDQLAQRLLPAGALWPADPPNNTEPWTGQSSVDYNDFAVSVNEMWRLRKQGKEAVLEEQSILSPAEAPSKVAPRGELPERLFERGSRRRTVAVMPSQACYTRAGLNETLVINWRGYIEEEEIKTKQGVSLTRLYERKLPEL